MASSIYIIVPIILAFLAIGNSAENHLKIWFGEQAKPGQFPYMASIQNLIKEKNFYQHWCGGAIISKKFILTAAHCLTDDDEPYKYLPPSNFKILVGLSNLASLGKFYSVSKVIPHPKFSDEERKPDSIEEKNVRPGMNDIALLELHNEIEYNENISCILPLNHSDLKNERYFPQSTAMGWGINEFQSRPTQLSFINGTAYKLRENQIFFTGKLPGQRIHAGDSGSPLVIADKYLAGVLSDYSDERLDIGVYAAVDHFMPWISLYTGDNPCEPFNKNNFLLMGPSN